jgi:hypothetical protein
MIVILAVVMGAPGFYFYVVMPRLRSPERRLLDRTKPTRIAALEEGKLARITGVVAPREGLLRSPVGGHPCIGYSMEIATKASSSAGEPWLPLLARRDCKAFSLTDDSGTAVVEGPFEFELDPDDGAWTNLPPQVYAMLDEAKVSLTQFRGDRDFRFQEALLKAGDRINVLGRATLQVDSATSSLRTPPRLYHVRGTADDPVVLADEADPALS